MDLKQVLKNTRFLLRYHGAYNQVPKAVEEMCELITELSKNYGHSTSKEKIQDEIADVIIMMLQMAQLFGFDEVRKRIEYKLHRQNKRISLARKDFYDTKVAEAFEDNIHYGE